jgi:hypothetical protein
LALFLHLTRTVHDGATNVVTDVGKLGRFLNGSQNPSENIGFRRKL